ncbi:hypothetical protein QR680_012998 [Steinernema hermaphroditum]|uniref:Uncharacterized protein n=1 Tax=Steinernema hermaphroditum TaxID=289476 RepID=A0AA39M0V2_9BILA|nr:hypothetical protein QR680_012998 [Steinernema hermaphroditum]
MHFPIGTFFSFVFLLSLFFDAEAIGTFAPLPRADALPIRIFTVEDEPRVTSEMVSRILGEWNISTSIEIHSADSVCQKLKEAEALNEESAVVLFKNRGPRAKPCNYSRHLKSTTRLQLFFGIMRWKDDFFEEERYATAFVDSRLGSLEYDLVDNDVFEHELKSTLLNFLFVLRNKEVSKLKLIPSHRNLTMDAMLKQLEEKREIAEKRGHPIAYITMLAALPGIVFTQLFVLKLVVTNGRKEMYVPHWFQAVHFSFGKLFKPSKETLIQVDNIETLEA